MTEFHAFEIYGEHLLFFPRSARLYQLSRQAARTVSELAGSSRSRADSETRPQAASVTLPKGPAQDDLSLELRELLRKELALPPPTPIAPPEKPGSNRFQTFVLYLSQSCNMSCCYCWNGGGSFGDRAHLMSRQEAAHVSGKILSLARRSEASEFRVNFYGGEPLLNFPVLKQITLKLLEQEGRLGKKFFFSVDTNGCFLEGDAARFLARHFSHIGVSVDGREEIHEFQRPGKFRSSTWHGIMANIRSFPKPGLLGLRATLTVFSDSYLETFLELCSAGVARIQLEYCHQPGYLHNSSFAKLMVPLERQLGELSQFALAYVEFIGRFPSLGEIPQVSNLLDQVARIKRGFRHTTPCGAGISTLAFDCHGTVFPCIAFVNRADFAMGSVATDDLSLHGALAGSAVDGKKHCRACWLRYDCGGGCHAANFEQSGRARQPHHDYCRTMRGRFEVYLYALAQMQNRCPWHLEPNPRPDLEPSHPH